MASVENINPQTIKRVAKEMRKLMTDAPEGIKMHFNEDDITDIQATIQGPVGTPYEGGLFRMKVVLGENFPSNPPKGFFITKIFHPNVAKNGAICVNTLKRDWKSDMGIEHVLTVCKCLLIHPNPASALNEEAGKLLLERYDDFAARAKMMTEVHAMPKNGESRSKHPSDGDVSAVAKKLKDKGADLKKKEQTKKKKQLKRL